MTLRPWLNAKWAEPIRLSHAGAPRPAAIQYRRPGCKNNRRQRGRRLSPSPVSLSGARVENRDGATILRPARNVVADRNRPFLAIRDRAHALGLHATRHQILAHRLRAPGTERDVVFARAALVGVSLDDERVLRIGAQPLRLFFKCADGLLR